MMVQYIHSSIYPCIYLHTYTHTLHIEYQSINLSTVSISTTTRGLVVLVVMDWPPVCPGTVPYKCCISERGMEIYHQRRRWWLWYHITTHHGTVEYSTTYLVNSLQMHIYIPTDAYIHTYTTSHPGTTHPRTHNHPNCNTTEIRDAETGNQNHPPSIRHIHTSIHTIFWGMHPYVRRMRGW